MHFRIILTYLILILSQVQSMGQENRFSKHEDSLAILGPLAIRGESDSIRTENAAIFKALMKQTLEMEGSFDYPFKKLETISLHKSSDQRFRIITWVVIKRDQSQFQYYGFLQSKDPKTGKITLFELKDSTENIINPEYAKLRTDNWYGAVYYEVISVGKKKNRQYTLLGWKGTDQKIQTKVIDVLKFHGSKAVFGSLIFEGKKPPKNRIVFKYNKQAVMSLKYHPSSKEIVFDNLSPSSPRMVGVYESYGPDFSYNAYKWKRNKWMYLENYDAKNHRSTESKPVKVRDEPGLIPTPKK